MDWNRLADNGLESSPLNISFLACFIQSKNDYSLFIKRVQNIQTLVAVYVDDILIIKINISDINSSKHMLESNFDIKNIEVTNVIEKVLDKFK